MKKFTNWYHDDSDIKIILIFVISSILLISLAYYIDCSQHKAGCRELAAFYGAKEYKYVDGYGCVYK